MAVTVADVTTNHVQSGGTIVATRPAGFTAASLALVIVGSDSNSNVDPPFAIDGGGWTEIFALNAGTSAERKLTAWVKPNPGDATNTITLGASKATALIYYRLEDADLVNSVDAVGLLEFGVTNGGANLTVVDTVTTVTDAALAFTALVFDGADGSWSFGAAAIGANGWGDLDAVVSDGGGAGASIVVCRKAMPTAGDAGQVELDPPVNDGWTAIQFAIRPAAGGADPEGAGSAAMSVTASATGLRTAMGSGSSAVVLSASATGQREALGAGSAGLALTAVGTGSTVGGNEGAGSAALEIAATATGQRTTFGSGSASLAIGSTAAGQRAALGAGSATMALAASGTGSASSPGTGAGSAAIAITATATGQRSTFGSGSAATAITSTATGQRSTFGAGTAGLVLSAVGTGEIEAPGDVTGAGSAAIAITAAATGQRSTFGAGSAVMALAASANTSTEAWTWLVQAGATLEPASARLGPGLDPTTATVA